MNKLLMICISLILIGIGLFALSLLAEQNNYHGLSEGNKMLYSFIDKQGQIIGKKFHMAQCATGLGGRGKVWLMSLSFEKTGDPMNEEEARKLIIECVDDFLKAVNNDEQLRPFLRNVPFTAKNIELNIYSLDQEQELHQFPSIAIVADFEGKIGFLTEDPSTKHGYHTKKYETYEEAVAILKQQKE